MLAPAGSEPDSTVTVPAGPEGPLQGAGWRQGVWHWMSELLVGQAASRPGRPQRCALPAGRPARAGIQRRTSCWAHPAREMPSAWERPATGVLFRVPGGCGPAGLGNARRPTASAAASRACGVSNRFLRRRRSLAVCRWSSQATNGPSGRESPSRRPSTTSVQPGAGRAGRLDQAGALQLLLPSWARHASRRPGSTQSMMASVRKLMAKIRIVRAGRGVIDAAPSALPGRLGSVIVV